MYMIDFLLSIYMVMYILILIIFFAKYMLMILMLVEFLIVSIMFMLFMYLSVYFQGFLVLYYMVFSVCESVLGLSLIVYTVRFYGDDLVSFMNLNLW